jgi:predicted ArsR family transcriptional regulator
MEERLQTLRRELMSQDKPGPDEQVTDAEILELIVGSEVPVATSSEIAQEGGISTTAARSRLERLVRKNALKRKDTGATVVYYPDCYEPPESTD